MENEEARLLTFDGWPLTYLSAAQLAKNGFYYLGRSDEVRCAFCKVEIMRWAQGDDPAEDHKKWAPQCPFVKKNTQAEPVSTLPKLGRPVHVNYANELVRLRSFKDWPSVMAQTPDMMSEAGFFYAGTGDKTKCFYCDLKLKDWNVDDDPWKQHARWSPHCAYVNMVKGNDFVQKIITEASCVVKDDVEEVNKDSLSCILCCTEQRNICCLPCRHVVMCAKCVLSTDTCPVCRGCIEDVLRVYIC
ncbi:iap-3 [Matsumuraeses phaseoli granulovirus]|uniref:Iap-3 n=1 Tax=Matsumuraeses phaseoli granulovirus TaxID=2760664 RepID=A0AAE7ML78_9BBAC|nr:iap-3 [Matsumuraeses phaseoli granulovirus]QOD39974.1 iap-3 [Matsumuraeses phaseoli granulovirus]